MSDRLRAIMRRHGLSVADVAALLCVSRHTVQSWLRPATSKAHRRMPAPMMELLLLKLRRQ
jgi:transcriptional regulator with XRE-family HTH domain